MGYPHECESYGRSLGQQIRNAETQRIPVMGIVGAKEVESETVSIRIRAAGDVGAFPVKELVEKLTSAMTAMDADIQWQ
ncbi:His/Gly/Thr/Pro-type tRNA ligase C-terminal domain-containing protein [Thermosynechococcus sp. B0]|uniref:His/Gly/Thr/Pro-type tRNA ligase C-terminal domain-containing protein n=1 Tax=unclassified Thermosynechococcus TaxID=2622553 RepID=UPI0025781A02|nr:MULTISPECIES: His/Gly/Thr/Pro-type tRNA ligase C-terminal domain-containing protein [unclassified Thermosynechococcus]WJI24980.1 His/Gly/Thr/Pro-type tRNA ligase C-terminal domain-containing protein [Thermosynechococcus sp. B0]WJI27504.1 His/Gly/Thr/Pro-type tRNA ligase C-terminal domain-containing protein [Thermosynechococcus sp. B1]